MTDLDPEAIASVRRALYLGLAAHGELADMEARGLPDGVHIRLTIPGLESAASIYAEALRDFDRLIERSPEE